MQKDRDDELAREIRMHLELEAEVAPGGWHVAGPGALRRPSGVRQRNPHAGGYARRVDAPRAGRGAAGRPGHMRRARSCGAPASRAWRSSLWRLGITGNATIFSLADALLLRGESEISHPDRLVDIGRTVEGLPRIRTLLRSRLRRLSKSQYRIRRSRSVPGRARTVQSRSRSRRDSRLRERRNGQLLFGSWAFG